jgi:hypothetical protein
MNTLAKAFNREPNTTKVDLIVEFLKSVEVVNLRGARETKILCELPLDPIYILLFKSFYFDVGRKNGSIKFVVTKSISAAIGTGIVAFLKRNYFISRFLTNKWLKLSQIRAADVAFFSCKPQSPYWVISNTIMAFRIWREWRRRYLLDTNSELIIDGIKCDDLVIDTFLRYKPFPKYSIDSIFNWTLIYQVLKDCSLTQHYIDTERVSAIIVSYTTYIVHGVLVRMGIKNNLKVFSFGDLGCFALRHSSDHLHHTRKGHDYYKNYNMLPREAKARLLEESETYLNSRLSGGFDPAIKYMKKSAYGHAPVEFGGGTRIDGSVVLFLHDFYDSPHIQDNLIFPDFYSWAKETIEFLVENEINYYVKPHPNQIPESDNAFTMLKRDIPHLKIIDSATNNRTLVENGLKLGISVYGTVCHELAYLGVKSVAAGDHPHIAFSFCYTPTTKRDYFDAILNGLNEAPDFNTVKLEATIFYGMHNYLNDLCLKNFLDTYNDFWFGANQSSCTADKIVLEKLMQLRSSPIYEEFIDDLIYEK